MREDILTAISKEKNISNVIILTHNIDFIFIQTILLKHLIKCGNPTLTIFADAQCVNETYESQKYVISGLGKRYRVVPVYLDRPYDRFHPKAVLLSGSDKATLYVGSGNLTFGGWRQNAEVWNSFDSLTDGTSVFNAFQEYLYGCLKRLPFTKNIDRYVHEAYDTSTKSWAKIPGEPRDLISRINSNKSLLDQMKELAPVSCELLIIQSPYFDNEGKTIVQLNDAFKPKQIEVFAQNKYSEITQKIIDALPTNASIVVTDFNHKSDDRTRRAFLHAKFYAFIYADRVIVFSGSANCSQAALALNNSTLGNAELMSVHTMSPSDFSTQYLEEIERLDDTYKPLEISLVEENLVDDEKSLQILAVQYEHNKIVVAYKASPLYEIIGCKIDDSERSVTIVQAHLLIINNIEKEPLRICLLLRNKQTNLTIISNEMWIDYESELSTSAKTRFLSDFIQSNSDLSWNHNTWGELIKVFNEHLTYTPKKTDSNFSESSVDRHEKMAVFNANDVFVNSYSFKPVMHIWNGSHSFDINTVLRQYLGLNNLHHGDEEGSDTPLTQEEIEAIALNGEFTVEDKVNNKTEHPAELVDEKSRKKIQKLIESLTLAFTNPEIIENRPLPLLLNDLKVASIILRMGMHKKWISDEDYFDATYTLWTELFFSSKKDKELGLIGYKLNNEIIDFNSLRSPELTATMLAWIFAVEPSRNIKYTRLILSAIMVHAKYNWVFWGGDQEKINEELNKTLLAIIDVEKVENTLQAHGALWEIITKTGSAFSELIEKLNSFKVSDFKDSIESTNVFKGELLWQGNNSFYIVKTNFNRTENPDIKTDVFSINSNKEDKSFVSSFTIPVTGMLTYSDKLISNSSKETILNFINSHLLDPA